MSPRTVKSEFSFVLEKKYPIMSEKSEDGNTPNNTMLYTRTVDPILELNAMLIKHRAEIKKEYNQLYDKLVNLLFVLTINFTIVSIILMFKK